jgi:multisubunit Na+/H+ antiporter MnhB subunit
MAFNTLNHFSVTVNVFRGQEETVLTVGVMDLNIVDTSPGGAMLYLVSLTIPRSLVRLLLSTPESTLIEC